MASEQAEVAYSPRDEAYRAYDLFESRGSADELSKLADLRARGVITDAQFQRARPRHWADGMTGDVRAWGLRTGTGRPGA
jgi:Short C-terminal domain